MISEDYSIIIGLSEKGMISVVHSSVSKNPKRTYISTLVFRTKLLAKVLKISVSNQNDINLIEKKLVQTLKGEGKKRFIYPFLHFSKFQIEKTQEKRKIYRLETKIINFIIKLIYQKYNYSDEIMKYPFSLISLDGGWEEWERVYYPYVDMIEQNIIKANLKNTKLYRYYDFALKSDIFQRVIDLLIVSKNEVKSDEVEDLYDYQITFVYCSRISKPYKYMSLLKFVNEIKNFTEEFKKDKKNKCHNLRSELILISQPGYEDEIRNYLRNHLIGETDYIIPLLTVPPINNKVWHNFIEYEPKPQKLNELQNIIRIGNKTSSSPSYRNNMVKYAKSEYDQIIEREKMAKLDNHFLDKWNLILNVSESKEILG